MKKYNLFMGTMILCMVLFLLTAVAFAAAGDQKSADENSSYFEFKVDPNDNIPKDEWDARCEIIPKTDTDNVSLDLEDLEECVGPQWCTEGEEKDQVKSKDDKAVYLVLYNEDTENFVWVGKFDLNAPETDELPKLTIKFISKEPNDSEIASDDPSTGPTEESMPSVQDVQKTSLEQEATDSTEGGITIEIEDGGCAILRLNKAEIYATISIQNEETYDHSSLKIEVKHGSDEYKEITPKVITKPSNNEVEMQIPSGEAKPGDHVFLKATYKCVASEEQEYEVQRFAEAELKDETIERNGDELQITGTLSANFFLDQLDDAHPFVIEISEDDSENVKAVQEWSLVDEKGESVTEIWPGKAYQLTCTYALQNTDAKVLHAALKFDSEKLGKKELLVPEKKKLVVRVSSEKEIEYDAKPHGLQLQARTGDDADWQDVVVNEKGSFSVKNGEEEITGTVYYKKGSKDCPGLPEANKDAASYSYKLRIEAENGYAVAWDEENPKDADGYVEATYTIAPKHISISISATQSEELVYNKDEQTPSFVFEATTKTEMTPEVEEILRNAETHALAFYDEDPIKAKDAGSYPYTKLGAMQAAVINDLGQKENYIIEIDVEPFEAKIAKMRVEHTFGKEVDYDGKAHSIGTEGFAEWIKEYGYKNNSLDLTALQEEQTDAGSYGDKLDCTELNNSESAKNYEFDLGYKLVIRPRDIAQENIKLVKEMVQYDKGEHKPQVNAGKLKRDEDYSVEYYADSDCKKVQTDFINAGETYVLVEGKGNYTGEIKLTFTIEPRNLELEGFAMKLSPDEFEFNGKEQKPQVQVVDAKGNELPKDAYTVPQFDGDTVQPGSITVIVKGQNNYSGSLRDEYRIKAPAPTPTAEPTAVPTATPTAEPTATPTPTPTATPTAAPTATPTPAPTASPTAEPTPQPTAQSAFHAGAGSDTPMEEGTADGKTVKNGDPSSAETGSMNLLADKQLLFLGGAAIVSLILFVFCLVTCKKQKRELEKERFKTLDHQSRRSSRTIHQEDD